MRIKKFVSAKKFSHILRHVSATIGVGAVIIVPFLIAYYVIDWLAEHSDNLFHILIDVIPIADKISGIGFILLLILFYLIGLIYKNMLGKKLVHFFQQLGLKTPLLKNIYKPAKGFTEIFTGGSIKQARVVGAYLYGGFVLGLYASPVIKDGVRCVNFYYLTAPTPTSGMTFILRETEVYAILIQGNEDCFDLTPQLLMERYLSCQAAHSKLPTMTLGQLLEHCISCGTSSPREIITRPLAYSE